MVIIALLIGLAVGALGVFLLVRPALIERRRRTDEVIDLQRELAGTRAELAVERSALDDRLAAAIKSLSADALDANSSRFLELADARLTGYVRPLKESLARMDQQLLGVERIRQEAYGALQTQVATTAPSGPGALRTRYARRTYADAGVRCSCATSSSARG